MVRQDHKNRHPGQAAALWVDMPATSIRRAIRDPEFRDIACGTSALDSGFRRNDERENGLVETCPAQVGAGMTARKARGRFSFLAGLTGVGLQRG